MARLCLYGSSLLSLFLLLATCASPIAPVGGEKDETPPQVVEAKSTPNFQTNFRPDVIEITFDEWVKLQDVNNQVIISPPVEQYEVTLSGKTVRVELNNTEPLRDSATYVIQFGEAIRDLTESNPTEDLRFVFSTGPTIDSLVVTGQVVDAYTDEAVKNVVVMLYENLADSVVRTERPFYFSRTDDQGDFRISNVRPGQFKIFALEDADLNYLYNQPNERIAFQTETIRVSNDTTTSPRLRLFRFTPDPRILRRDTSRYGQLKLTFNQRPPTALSITTEPPLSYLSPETLQDTLWIWYDQPAPAPFTLFLRDTTVTYADTLRINPPDRATLLERLPFQLVTGPRPGERINPGNPLRLTFRRPPADWDTTLISLLADTLLTPTDFQLETDGTAPRSLLLRANWREGLPYQLIFLPGAVTDIYGTPLSDTLNFTFSVDLRKNFGSLTLNFSTPDTSMAYLVLLNNKSNQTIATYRLQGDDAYQRSLRGLATGDYQLVIIIDRNNNGRWDAGDYDAGRQPETVLIKTLEPLRANWDLEADVELPAGGG